MNAYVEALHKNRSPMGLSLYQVLGEMASLDELPYIDAPLPDPGEFTHEFVEDACELCERLSRYWDIVEHLDTFPWVGYKGHSYSPQTRQTLVNELRNCTTALESLGTACGVAAEKTGLTCPKSIEDARTMVAVLELLQRGPGVEEGWMALSDLERSQLKESLIGCKATSERYQAASQQLREDYLDGVFLFEEIVGTQFRDASECLSSVIGSDVMGSADYVARRSELLDWTRDLRRRIAQWQADGKRLGETLGIAWDGTIAHVRKLCRVADICDSTNKPDKGWLSPRGLAEAERAYAVLKDKTVQRRLARERLLTDYRESLLDLDCGRLLAEYQLLSSSWTYWLKPAFYRIRRQVRLCHKQGALSPNVAADLALASSIQQLEREAEELAAQHRTVLGVWYRGFESDFTALKESLRQARAFAPADGRGYSTETP